MKTAVENATQETHAPKKAPPPAKREWLKTAGWAKNDTLYAEALRLGQEYRCGMTVVYEGEGKLATFTV